MMEELRTEKLKALGRVLFNASAPHRLTYDEQPSLGKIEKDVRSMLALLGIEPTDEEMRKLLSDRTAAHVRAPSRAPFACAHALDKAGLQVRKLGEYYDT